MTPDYVEGRLSELSSTYKTVEKNVLPELSSLAEVSTEFVIRPVGCLADCLYPSEKASALVLDAAVLARSDEMQRSLEAERFGLASHLAFEMVREYAFGMGRFQLQSVSKKCVNKN